MEQNALGLTRLYKGNLLRYLLCGNDYIIAVLYSFVLHSGWGFMRMSKSLFISSGFYKQNRHQNSGKKFTF